MEAKKLSNYLISTSFHNDFLGLRDFLICIQVLVLNEMSWLTGCKIDKTDMYILCIDTIAINIHKQDLFEALRKQ